MWRRTKVALTVAAVLLRAAAAGVTGRFDGLPAARPLNIDEVKRLLANAHLRGDFSSRRLQAADASDPVEQVHVGLGGQGEAVVTFVTRSRGHPSLVRYGLAEVGLLQQASGEVATYNKIQCLSNTDLRNKDLSTDGVAYAVADTELAELVNSSRLGLPPDSLSYLYIEKPADAWDHLDHSCINYKNPLAYWESPYIHTVVLTGLQPRANYIYRPEGATRMFNFTMPPRAGDPLPVRPLKLAVWGDIGVTNISFNAMLQVARTNADLVLTVGDYSYADGWSHRWELFGTMMEPMMSSIVGLGVAGNHEIASGFMQNVDFVQRYPQPYRHSGSTSPVMHSYETGLVHVLSLPGSYAPSWNTSEGRPSEQYLFAANDLAKVDRTRTPWVIVMFHTPWYASNTKHYMEGIKHQWDMEELLHYHGVDIVFNGHVHAYERTVPVFRYKPDTCGAVHVVIGDAGNYEGPATTWREPQPDWSAFRVASFGTGLLTVLDATHALWEWHRMACATKAEGKSYYEWENQLGLHGEPCLTAGDTSATASFAVDSTLIVRDVSSCPNKLQGYGYQAPRGQVLAPKGERLAMSTMPHAS